MPLSVQQKTYSVLVVIANSAGAALLGIVGWYGWDDLTWWAPLGLVLGLAFLAVPPIINAFVEVRTAEVRERDAETRQRSHALSTLVEATYVLVDLPPECDLRVTLLKVNENHNPARLEQAARYSALGRGLGKSSMNINQGFAGLCYRTVPPTLTHIPDVANFHDEMIRLGFTEEEVRQFKVDRRTYLCVPVVDSAGAVTAVLSLDSKAANAFDEPRIQIAERITSFFASLLEGP